VRCDVAIHRLVHSAATVDEIGEEPGFLDASAFHRAFKRWSGLQPGEYRRQRRT
jgi:AraC-like DNA-binding protein